VQHPQKRLPGPVVKKVRLSQNKSGITIRAAINLDHDRVEEPSCLLFVIVMIRHICCVEKEMTCERQQNVLKIGRNSFLKLIIKNIQVKIIRLNG